MPRDRVAIKLDSQVRADQLVKGLLVHFKVIECRVVVSELVERHHIIVVKFQGLHRYLLLVDVGKGDVYDNRKGLVD